MEFMASSRAMEECFFLSVGPRFVCITQKRMQMGDTIHILPLVLLINRGGQLRRRLLANIDIHNTIKKTTGFANEMHLKSFLALKDMYSAL